LRWPRISGDWRDSPEAMVGALVVIVIGGTGGLAGDSSRPTIVRIVAVVVGAAVVLTYLAWLRHRMRQQPNFRMKWTVIRHPRSGRQHNRSTDTERSAPRHRKGPPGQ
jgi:hypothetical protein